MSMILDNIRFEGAYSIEDFNTFDDSPGIYLVACGENFREKFFFVEVGQSESIKRHFREVVRPEWWAKECRKENIQGDTLSDVIKIFIHYNAEMTEKERQDFVDQFQIRYKVIFKTYC